MPTEIHRTEYLHKDGAQSGSWSSAACSCRYAFGTEIGRLYLIPCEGHAIDNPPFEAFSKTLAWE